MSAPSEFVGFITTAANWSGHNGITHRMADHVRISVISVAIAGGLAIPPAMVLGHVKRGGIAAAALVNVGRAVPSFAILSILFPLSLEYGFGLGFLPTVGALVLLAIPPIFTNVYTGVRDVDPNVVEASRGMGMRPIEVLLRVEAPAARPLILTGLRLSSVQVVATATLGALVGFGGLGAFIVAGFSQQDDGKLLTGAFLVALLAIITELAFSAAERLLTPWTRKDRS
jgi:osmoprotectant transport system permease protein